MFVYGVQYYRPPNPPISDWERDLKLIKEFGFNTVKFFAVWGWINKCHQEYDFKDLDILMDLCEDVGLKVVININIENAPYWLEETYPEARYVSNDGLKVKTQASPGIPSGGSPGLCLDHPKVRLEAEKFFKEVLLRYKDHPALFLFDLWNEPHIEPTWYYKDKLFCYCESSRKKFQEWLKNKYKTLRNLELCWGRHYSSWTQVRPPERFGSYPDMIDWRKFWLENLRDNLSWRVRLAREVAPKHPVMTHVASSAYLGAMAYSSWDEWMLSLPCDKFGSSSFPGWLMKGDLSVHMFHLEMIRDASRGKPFWQSELQAGYHNIGGLNRTGTPSISDIKMWNWNVLSAGAKGLMYWQWRPDLLGFESSACGLCDVSGKPTDRAKIAGKMAKFVAKVKELESSKPVASEIGVIVSRNVALLNFAAERDQRLYAKALMGIYRAFYDNNIPISFIHTDILEETVKKGTVRFLYFPFPFAISSFEAQLLKKFVGNGGVLMAEACPAHFDEHGHCSSTIPGQGLDELFGVREVKSERTKRFEIDLIEKINGVKIKRIFGYFYREHLTKISPKVVTLARDEEGHNLITLNQFGKGKAILVGSYPSIAYEIYRDAENAQFITAFENLIKVKAKTNLDSRYIKTRIHQLKDGCYLIFILNLYNLPQIVQLNLEGISFDLAIDLLHQKKLNKENNRTILVKIEPQDGTIIKLK